MTDQHDQTDGTEVEAEDEEWSDEEYQIRQGLLGLIAQAAYANMEEYIYDGVMDEELVLNQIDEHIGVLEAFDTPFLMRHILLTFGSDDYYHA